MQTGRWLNQGQPQTLVYAVMLLYIDAAFGVLDVIRFGIGALGVIIGAYYAVRIAGGVIAGRGIAEERRWAYALALVVAVAPFALSFWATGNPLPGDILTLVFELLVLGLLLHPQSRDYQRIWFK